MSFVKNNCQQLNLLDITNSLTAREKKILEKSWAKDFSERIFPLIDEKPYSVLYSNNDASRPNTPVNIIIGSLVIKELLDLTDDELLESSMLDIRFRYALNTTSYEEQPISDRTLSRFRERCYKHELETGEDLVKDTVTELSGEMAAIMKINGRLKRMDSLMIASNIKKLSRLELLYTCLSNLVTCLHKLGSDDIIAGCERYYDPTDYNRMIYHNRSTDTDERIQQVIDDAEKIIKMCGETCDDLPEYQLLQRALREQTTQDASGKARLKTKADGGMDSAMLQNPSDPDATYREKSGKQYKGYVSNIEESVGENGSIITNYQYEPNTYSDSRFLSETIEAMGKQDEKTTISLDGAFDGMEIRETAEQNNIRIVTTDLIGRKANDIYADFKFNDDGRQVLECAAGIKPKSCGYISSSGQCRISYHRDNCVNCIHKDNCQPKIYKHTAVLFVSNKTAERAKIQRQMETDEYRRLTYFRNGVESIPSVLRRRYDVDHMPVRGKIRSKFFFGFKIAAINFRKVFKYLCGLDKPVQIDPVFITG